MSKDVPQGAVAQLSFSTFSSAGLLVDADSLPVITNIQVNGVDQSISGTVVEQAQDSVPSNITGRYALKVPTSSLSAGDQVTVYFEAVIETLTRPATATFTTVNRDGDLPSIKVS